MLASPYVQPREQDIFNLILRITLSCTWASLPIAAVVSEATASPLLPVVYQESTAQKQKAAADYLLQGNKKLQERDFDGAIAAYDKAISLDPNYALA